MFVGKIGHSDSTLLKFIQPCTKSSKVFSGPVNPDNEVFRSRAEFDFTLEVIFPDIVAVKGDRSLIVGTPSSGARMTGRWCAR